MSVTKLRSASVRSSIDATGGRAPAQIEVELAAARTRVADLEAERARLSAELPQHAFDQEPEFKAYRDQVRDADDLHMLAVQKVSALESQLQVARDAAATAALDRRVAADHAKRPEILKLVAEYAAHAAAIAAILPQLEQADADVRALNAALTEADRRDEHVPYVLASAWPDANGAARGLTAQGLANLVKLPGAQRWYWNRSSGF